MEGFSYPRSSEYIIVEFEDLKETITYQKLLIHFSQLLEPMGNYVKKKCLVWASALIRLKEFQTFQI